MTPTEINDLKKQVDILSLCGTLDIKLNKSGQNNYMTRCPFPDHEDKNPSFSVDPSKGLYHCFGCGRKGDQISLVRELKGFSFPEALNFLDERFNGGRLKNNNNNGTHKTANLTIKNILSTEKTYTEEQKQGLLFRVANHYHKTFKENDRAIEYLKKRGIYSEDLIREFKIGCANRTLHLVLKPEDRDLALDIGILREYNGQRHEAFNGCITFVISDEADSIQEMYGRKILDRQKEGSCIHNNLKGQRTGVFNEKAFDFDELIVCESITDAFSFMIHGIMNVTATLGTNGFTEHYVNKLRASKVKKVIIAYDNDQGGNSGTDRLLEIINKENVEIKRVLLPKGFDINDYMLSFTEEQREEKLKDLVKESISIYVPEQKNKGFDLSYKDKELFFQKGERVYRIRGLENNQGVEQLKVNLKVSLGDLFHLDIFNLLSSRMRNTFIKEAAIILGIDIDILSSDISQLLIEAEKVHDQILAGQMCSTPKEHVITAEEEAVSLRFLNNRKLDEELLDDFNIMGYVGEEDNKLSAYFCARTSKMRKALSTMVTSRSAAGKTALQDAILEFTPEEEQVKYTQMTDKSLFYMKDGSVQNKVLAISECEGVLGAFYAIKTLQSEGELKIASTGKDPITGRMETQEYHVQGPVSFILTTTQVELDEEVSNRFIHLTVDESFGQTKRIQDQQRFEQTLEGQAMIMMRKEVALKHKNAARLLRSVIVVNPYATHLTFLENVLRARRDNQKYLYLIAAITFVYQYQRPIKQAPTELGGFEYIETTIDDIRLANRLAKHIFVKSLDELAPHSRRLLDIIAEMVEKKIAQKKEREIKSNDAITFTRREIREYSGWDHWQIRDHIRQLEELEYIIAITGKKGRKYEYELNYGDSDSKGCSINLADPDELISFKEKA